MSQKNYLDKSYAFLDSIDRDFDRLVHLMAEYKYNNKVLYIAQECLIDLLITIGKEIRALRETRGELVRTATTQILQYKNSGKNVPKEAKEQSSVLYGEAKELEQAISDFQSYKWLLRYLGDGIAWHALGFERSLIRTMGSKDPVGPPSESDLLRYRKLARKIRRETNREVLPLIHDLTNCLRTDDLSLIGNGKIYSVELKLTEDGDPSRRRDKRSDRQGVRRQKIYRYLETGRMDELYPERQGGRLYESEVIQFHNFEAISEGLSRARKDGYGIVRPEKALMYIVSESSPQAILAAIGHARDLDPIFFQSIITFRSIEPREDDYHDTLPITSMELDPNDIIEIMSNRFSVVVLLNFKLLQEQFLEAGLELTLKHEKHSVEAIVEREPRVSIQQGSWDKVLLEAFSIGSLIAQIKEVQDINPETNKRFPKNRLTFLDQT